MLLNVLINKSTLCIFSSHYCSASLCEPSLKQSHSFYGTSINGRVWFHLTPGQMMIEHAIVRHGNTKTRSISSARNEKKTVKHLKTGKAEVNKS